MDSATIIGTTSAILSFVQFTGKVISVAYKIHGSSHGAIDDNKNLEEAVTGLQIRLKGLRTSGESSCSTDYHAEASGLEPAADNTLLTTARECEDLGNNLLKILNKTKSKAVQVDEKRSASMLRRAWKRFRKDAPDDVARPRSKPTLLEGIRASIHTVWHEDELRKLCQKWESCVIRLDMNLQRSVKTPNLIQPLCPVTNIHR